MKVKVLETFKCAPEGHTVIECLKGDILEGKAAEIALRLKKGEEVEEAKKTPKPKVAKKPKPKVAKKPKPKHEG